ncbi:hypothetical protein VPH35_076017 [Triticum aestivum]
MIYLLFFNPEMLLPGTNWNLFTTANAELEEILKDDNLSLRTTSLRSWISSRFMQRIIAKVQPKENTQQVVQNMDLETDVETGATTQSGFIIDAWKLANGLLHIGVWVEMLCFSASRCRGYLHAKSLGTGGELLTYIWLLLSQMGMETLPDRLHRTELSTGEGNDGATPSTSQVSTLTGKASV